MTISQVDQSILLIKKPLVTFLNKYYYDYFKNLVVKLVMSNLT